MIIEANNKTNNQQQQILPSQYLLMSFKIYILQYLLLRLINKRSQQLMKRIKKGGKIKMQRLNFDSFNGKHAFYQYSNDFSTRRYRTQIEEFPTFHSKTNIHYDENIKKYQGINSERYYKTPQSTKLTIDPINFPRKSQRYQSKTYLPSSNSHYPYHPNRTHHRDVNEINQSERYFLQSNNEQQLKYPHKMKIMKKRRNTEMDQSRECVFLREQSERFIDIGPKIFNLTITIITLRPKSWAFSRIKDLNNKQIINNLQAQKQQLLENQQKINQKYEELCIKDSNNKQIINNLQAQKQQLLENQQKINQKYEELYEERQIMSLQLENIKNQHQYYPQDLSYDNSTDKNSDHEHLTNENSKKQFMVEYDQEKESQQSTKRQILTNLGLQVQDTDRIVQAMQQFVKDH